MSETRRALTEAREAFDKRVADLRPALHRYCTRMTGSAVDGEDVVQEALAKAFYALPLQPETVNLRAWLFRIAHNKAIDFTRRYEHRHAEPFRDEAPPTAEDPPIEERELARWGLGLFMELSAQQRSAVFLKDVLGHTLGEISEINDVTVSAVKASLHRGRARLRELAVRAEDVPAPALEARELERLGHYIACFNARDFDSVRAMLADDAKLDVVGRNQRRGARQVGEYVHRYSLQDDWHFVPGRVDGVPVALVIEDPSPEPVYFVRVEWNGDEVASIRDYRYARHVIGEAEVATDLPPSREGDPQ